MSVHMASFVKCNWKTIRLLLGVLRTRGRAGVRKFPIRVHCWGGRVDVLMLKSAVDQPERTRRRLLCWCAISRQDAFSLGGGSATALQSRWQIP